MQFSASDIYGVTIGI